MGGFDAKKVRAADSTLTPTLEPVPGSPSMSARNDAVDPRLGVVLKLYALPDASVPVFEPME